MNVFLKPTQRRSPQLSDSDNIVPETHERRLKILSHISMPILFFQACMSFLRLFRKGDVWKCWQFPISFLRRFGQKWSISVFACSHENAVAHVTRKSHVLRCLQRGALKLVFHSSTSFRP